MSKSTQQRIDGIKQQILKSGAIHPGRITEQYNVCGTAGCQCKDPDHPRKHGPYHYLSYTFQGKGKTVFVPQGCVAEMQQRTERYRRLKALWVEWVEASIELARQQVLAKDSR